MIPRLAEEFGLAMTYFERNNILVPKCMDKIAAECKKRKVHSTTEAILGMEAYIELHTLLIADVTMNTDILQWKWGKGWTLKPNLPATFACMKEKRS